MGFIGVNYTDYKIVFIHIHTLYVEYSQLTVSLVLNVHMTTLNTTF